MFEARILPRPSGGIRDSPGEGFSQFRGRAEISITIPRPPSASVNVYLKTAAFSYKWKISNLYIRISVQSITTLFRRRKDTPRYGTQWRSNCSAHRSKIYAVLACLPESSVLISLVASLRFFPSIYVLILRRSLSSSFLLLSLLLASQKIDNK